MADCQEPAPLRTYGGVDGDRRKAQRRTRLIDAGLDLLGSADGDRLSVRGVCKRAGLATRYFYESFPDRDALACAVFDHAVEAVAESTLAAVTVAGVATRSKISAGIANIVQTVGGDPRIGRLLFSTALAGELFAARRRRSTVWFVRLLGDQVREHYGETTRPEATSQFVVGGFAQVLTAWLDGALVLDEAALIEHCTELFARVAARNE